MPCDMRMDASHSAAGASKEDIEARMGIDYSRRMAKVKLRREIKTESPRTSMGRSPHACAPE